MSHTMTTGRASRRAADGELVRRALAGEARAWGLIVERHQGLMWWTARQFRLGTDDAADAVQLTWLRCLEHLHQLTDETALGSWLVTICRRECFRLLTRRGSEVLLGDWDDDQAADWFTAPAPDPCDVATRSDERDRLREAIDELPARPRSVLLALLTHEGEGYAQIAEDLGVPVGSLGPTRNRALARLRSDPRLVLADA